MSGRCLWSCSTTSSRRWSTARIRPRRSRTLRSWSFCPDAVSRISWKKRSPASWIVSVPSMIVPQLMSMSSSWCDEERRVGRELERGRGLAAVGRAAPGGEADHVGAAGHLAGRRHRVVARRVHVDEALRRHRLGVFVDVDQVGGAALGHRAQRLLEDGGEAARLVAGRGVVVHLVAVARGVVLPPADALDQLLADLAADRAARQQVLGAVDLRRLRQDRGAAVAHQQVDRRAQRRIGADARIAVGAAALQAERRCGSPAPARASPCSPRGSISFTRAMPFSHRLRACRRSPGW